MSLFDMRLDIRMAKCNLVRIFLKVLEQCLLIGHPVRSSLFVIG